MIQRVDLHRQLLRLVRSLDEPYRTTLLLRYFDGLPPRVIAVRMGVPAATVSTRVHRGLAQLRARLDAEHGSRRAWLAALGPIGLPDSGSGASLVAALTGGLFVGLKSWIAIVAACAALFFLVVNPALQGSDGGRSAGEGAESGEGMEAGLAGRGESAVAAEEEPAVDPFASIDRSLDLHGLVTDAKGRPIAGASVETYTLPWQRVNLFNLVHGRDEVAGPGTTTAADGSFVVRLRRGAEVQLRVRAKGFVEKRVADCIAGERVSVVLDGGGRYRVTTVDEDGAPIAGARVRLWHVKSSGLTATEWVVMSDAAGHAAFDGLFAGARHSLEVVHAEYAPPGWRELYPRVGDEQRLTVVLRAGRVLRGTVRSAETGEAIPGARIGLGWTLHKAVRADAEGRFELRGYDPETGYTDLHVTADGYTNERVRPPFGESLDVELALGTPVVGRVVDTASKPIEGAFVAVAETGYATAKFARSAADGTFRLGAVRKQRPHLIVAYAPGYGRMVFDFTTTQGEEHGIGDLILPPARSIEGVVLLPSGQPARGIAVELRGWNANRDMFEPGIPVVSDRYGCREVRQTDDLGRFRFPDLSPGAYSIAALPTNRKTVGTTVELVEADSVATTELQLTGGFPFRVHVRDAAGEPIPGVNISIACADMIQFGQYTGPTGTVEIDADTRPVSVEVATPFQPEAWALPPLRKVIPGEEEVTITLHRAGRATGVIVDPDGKPVPSAFLEVFADGKPFTQLSTFVQNQLSADLEGRFKAQVPLTGDVEIVAGEVVRPDGSVWAGRLTDVRAGQTGLKLQLTPIAFDRTMTVRALRPDGTPAKDVQVYLRVRGKLVPGANARTDENGQASFERLPAARVTVFAQPTPETTEADGWLIRSKYPVEANGQTLTIQFAEARILRGVVVDAKGVPVPDATVGAWHGMTIPGTVKSDEDGRFELRLDPTAEGALNVFAADARRQARATNVGKDVTELTLTLSE